MSVARDDDPADSWTMFAGHLAASCPFFIDRGAANAPSFAGSDPSGQLVVERDGSARVWRSGRWEREAGDPVDAIARFVEHARAHAAAVPPFLTDAALPRVVGYIGYELGAWTDGRTPACELHSVRQQIAGTPLAVLSVYDAFDAWDPATRSHERIRFRPSGGALPPPLDAPSTSSWIATSREEYREAFGVIRRAIAAGDIYQANLSRRAVFPFDGNAAAAYRRIRRVQPVPWGAFLDFGGFALLSNSPECFLSRHGARVETRPIKGTRRRRSAAAADAAERESLRLDPKELAEHLMIVDLERSDLGRVARTGTVEVNHLANIESYATLHHMVSQVRAQLRDNVGVSALLRATFPGGSITGAPKIRAMEILREVERAERGPYTGAIGHGNGADDLELSIAIRTAVTCGRSLLYSTGGGIVADSDCDREWDETELKVAALREALACEEIPRAATAGTHDPAVAGTTGENT